MCTVVCRWDPKASFPVQLLALRDEVASRAFDRPDNWWPEQPGVIGGRDRQAGGSWCVSDIATGTTAVVLNRPERRVAAPGAPSRGRLPLVAIEHHENWAEHIDVVGMASFNLVLVERLGVTWWRFDGDRLEAAGLPVGTHIITPSGLRPTPHDPRLLTARANLDDELGAPTEEVWTDWLTVLQAAVPSPDSDELLVLRPLPNGESYETVFAQFIAARPGTLRLDYLVDPGSGGAWTSRLWGSDPAPGS